MEREHSNVGTFFFKYEEIPEGGKNPEKVEESSENVSVSQASSEMRQTLLERNNSLARLHKTKLNYSQEDIHALATKAELLVLTGSNHDLRVASSERAGHGEEDEKRSECFPDDAVIPDLDIIDTNYEEPCLSGTWEHDIQEQYLSEGSALGTWDNSMKSVLCFGEDYSNYIRRKSELPSIDLISSNSEGLQVTQTCFTFVICQHLSTSELPERSGGGRTGPGSTAENVREELAQRPHRAQHGGESDSFRG